MRMTCMVCILTMLGLLTRTASAAETPGISKRIPWTTSRVVGSPDPPSPYTTEVAFPHLLLKKAVAISNAPGTDRLFVADRTGKVFSLPNDPAVKQADLVLDIGREIYGMTFHPKFAENGYLYLFITQRKPEPPRTRIARFTLSSHDPPTADPASEHIILEFPTAGHDGGCIKFGPDGYLYIGTGDGGSVNDQHLTGQDLGDLLASILRIDVDGKHAAKSYAIPPDNPFLNTPGARPEIYAYGFRQPWKFSFDRETGDLWVGDVGQDLWEMICLVRPGGNYGWSITEGPQAFRPERPRGPTPIIPPVIAHGHGEARSITGGFVYRGSRLKEFEGVYIYADYETGKIWGLRYDGAQVTWNEELADTTLDIAGFGEDHAGELYLLTHEGGQIHRLIPTPPSAPTPDFPRLLSETGLFASTTDHTPAPGVIPYSVNSPLWSDHATKQRFLAVPGDDKIEYTAERGWKFGNGAVLVKTFSLEMEQGNPESSRRLETRIMTRQQNEWAGYTYLWNEEQTDAELLGSDSLQRTYEISDADARGGVRKQTWHFPSRAECMICHNEKGGLHPGRLSTIQMNRDHPYAEAAANQIRTLDHLGLFTKPLKTSPQKLGRLVDPDDANGDLNDRARSYLAANCVHCHRYKGGGNSNIKLMYELPLAETETVNVKPLHGTLDIPEARLIVPGKPDASLIYRRMLRKNQGRMPHIGSLEVDDKGAQLIRRWIAELQHP